MLVRKNVREREQSQVYSRICSDGGEDRVFAEFALGWRCGVEECGESGFDKVWRSDAKLSVAGDRCRGCFPPPVAPKCSQLQNCTTVLATYEPQHTKTPIISLHFLIQVSISVMSRGVFRLIDF